MYNYTNLYEDKSLNFNITERVIRMNPYRALINATDILYEYRAVFERMKVLKGLRAGVYLMDQSRELRLEPEKRMYIWYFEQIQNEPNNQADWYMFCEIKHVVNYTPQDIRIQCQIYLERVLKPLKKIFPEMKDYLEETEILLEKVIDLLEKRTTIVIPGKIVYETDNSYVRKKEYEKWAL